MGYPDGQADHLLDPSGELRALASDCVHCGFCLPACPTYQLWGEEMDSPRGRIHLISQLLDGAQASPVAATHIDRCLGCMACVPACPSGVRYDRLIEAARSWTEEPPGAHPRPAPPGPHASQQARPLAHPPGRPLAHRRPRHQLTRRPGHWLTRRFAWGPRAWLRPARRRASSRRGPLPARSLRDRAIRAAIFQTFPYPNRLRLLTAPLRAAQRTGLDRLLERSGLASRLAPELAAALRLAPASPVPPASQPPASQPAAGQPYAPAGLARTRSALRAGRRASRPGQRRVSGRRAAERAPAQGPRRAVVGMLAGCVQQVFFPQVNAATIRVLAAEGCDVIIPAGQGCCGALPLHGGRLTEAARFARAAIEVFERAGVDAIVVNAAGCGSAMKEYAELLAGDPDWAGRAAALAARVRDFSEFLAELGPAATRHPLPVTVAYHDACHLAQAQRITIQPRELLLAVPELRLAEIADGGICCGSAGIYNLVQPEAARELGERKARTVHETGAALLVSANPGCTMQIAASLAAQGTPLPVAHIAEVLDASIRARPVGPLLAGPAS